MKRATTITLHQPPHSSPQPGFALIVALSIMAFTVLLLLSLTTLVQIEISTSSIHQQKYLAKENARLALYMALGELQKHAGPDQRVTARAEILDSNPETLVPDNVKHPYWTGVWDTTHANPSPKWLVSGNHPDPISDPLEIKIVGEHSVGSDVNKHVYVKAETPGLERNWKFQNRCAYWIGDESVKSSLLKTVNLNDYNHEDNPNALSELEIKRSQQLTPTQPKNELFFSELNAIAANNAVQDLWASEINTHANTIDFHNQLNLLPTFSHYDPLQKTTEVNAHFHNVTVRSLGVLANTESGGLKMDLSDPSLIDPDCPFPMNAEFRSFVAQRTDKDDTAQYRGVPNADTLMYGDPINPIAPITTEIGLYFGLFRESVDSNKLKVEFNYRADVWNPLSVPMKMVPGSQTDLLVKVTGLPNITFTWNSGTDSRTDTTLMSGAITFDPQNDTIINKEDNNPLSLESIPVHLGTTIRAGKNDIAKVKGVSWLPSSIAQSDEITTSNNSLVISAPASTITIEIRSNSGELIQKFENLEFQEFTRIGKIKARSGDPDYKDFHCVFNTKFNDATDRPEVNTLSDIEKWLSVWDVRRLNWSPTDNEAHASMIFVNPDPAFAINDETIFSEAPEFFYSKVGVKIGSSLDTDYKFFDYPTTPPISVGYLNHLSFHQERPYSIGNPWGNHKNEVFDRYFFSTIPPDGNTDYQLQNHHLTLIESEHLDPKDTITSGEHAAKHLMIQGAFNINSTSVEAWKAILSGIQLNDWHYKIHDGGIMRPSIKNGIFKFPFGADQSFVHPYEEYPDYPEISQAERKAFYKNRRLTDWGSSFSLGMRELRTGKNATDPIDDVDDLAQAIVHQLKLRQKPLNSIKELVNLNIIQQAIDQTKINTVGAFTYDKEIDPANKFPRYSPSFLSQADVINMLAPFASTRSDTFVIRAYGEAYNTIHPKQSSKAWCEAIVQRIPSPHKFRNIEDGQKVLEDYSSSPSPFGRKFKIVNFKWLSENEI